MSTWAPSLFNPLGSQLYDRVAHLAHRFLVALVLLLSGCELLCGGRQLAGLSSQLSAQAVHLIGGTKQLSSKTCALAASIISRANLPARSKGRGERGKGSTSAAWGTGVRPALDPYLLYLL